MLNNNHNYHIVFFLSLNIIFSIQLNSQIEIGLLPINVDLNERVFVDAFKTLESGVEKTHQAPYEEDIEKYIETYLKRYLGIKEIKLIDFPMDKSSSEEMKIKRKLYYNLNSCLRYIKEKNSLKGRIAFNERTDFKKKTPPKVPNELIKEFAEKMDQPFLLHVKAAGSYYRSKKEINKDAPYKKTPHGYLRIDVTLLDGLTGEIIATFNSKVGDSRDRVAMIKRWYKLGAKKFARQIDRAIKKHSKK